MSFQDDLMKAEAIREVRASGCTMPGVAELIVEHHGALHILANTSRIQALGEEVAASDTEAGAKQLRGKTTPIVPGDPAGSELIRRIGSENAAQRMPPAYSGLMALSAREVALIRRWVEQGARWQTHWAFLTPQHRQAPPVKLKGWARNSIDSFVLARMESQGLHPSPEADRALLLRRVTLDLTGKGPTQAEMEVFLADKSPRAYEKARNGE